MAARAAMSISVWMTKSAPIFFKNLICRSWSARATTHLAPSSFSVAVASREHWKSSRTQTKHTSKFRTPRASSTCSSWQSPTQAAVAMEATLDTFSSSLSRTMTSLPSSSRYRVRCRPKRPSPMTKKDFMLRPPSHPIRIFSGT